MKITQAQRVEAIKRLQRVKRERAGLPEPMVIAQVCTDETEDDVLEACAAAGLDISGSVLLFHWWGSVTRAEYEAKRKGERWYQVKRGAEIKGDLNGHDN